MMQRSLLAALIGFITSSQTAEAGSFTASIGPEQLGTGGAFPQAMPPTDPFQWGFTWVTERGIEGTLSLCPGLVLGYRYRVEGLYLSVGGGLIVDGNGSGIGPYSSFGYESGGGTAGWHFTASYTQGLGYSKNRYLAPSAMRFGVIWEY